ncbi:hypothetical protein [Synoicihabitans lomoniglobus]
MQNNLQLLTRPRVIASRPMLSALLILASLAAFVALDADADA